MRTPQSGNEYELLYQASSVNDGQVIKKAEKIQIPIAVPATKQISEAVNISTIKVVPVIQTKSEIVQQSKQSDAVDISPIKVVPVVKTLSEIVQQSKQSDAVDISPIKVVPKVAPQSGNVVAKTPTVKVIPQSGNIVQPTIKAIAQSGNIIKPAPIQKYTTLDEYKVYINDTDTQSKYFTISEFPTVLSAGINFFLIQGTKYLQPFTEIKFEVLDSKGVVIYSELSDALINGTSRMIRIYVYDGITNLGDATVTILGVLSDVPSQWKNSYNVKWQKVVNVNTLIGDTKPPILKYDPTVDCEEFYDVSNSYTISKVQTTYSITS